MKIIETRVYRGPNPYGYRPVIRMTVDLEELENYPSGNIPGFNEKLLELMPSLDEHASSYDEPGGFLLRLNDENSDGTKGTLVSNVMEHVAIELQVLAGSNVSFGKARSVTDKPGQYHVVYSYQEERVGIEAGKLAVKLIRSLLPPDLPSAMDDEEREEFSFYDERDDLIDRAQDLVLGPTTASLVEEARRRDIPAIRLDDQSLVQLGYGKYQQRIRASVTSMTSNIAVETASDKELTLKLLRDVGIPVPQHILVKSLRQALNAAEDLGFPLVTKPFDASHGRGISLNLMTLDEVEEGYMVASEFGPVLVETFLTGKDYRALVVNNELIAVAERVPAHVIGDGEHSIDELIEIVNRDPRRGFGHEKVLTKIKITHQSEQLLKKVGYTLETVLQKGEIFYLASTANMSTGGTAIDRTSEIHYETRELIRRAAMVIGLDIAGIDIITPDITQPLREVGGGIVEVNAGPGFRMHIQPSEGQGRNVARHVVDMLFPKGTPTRVPIISITGTNGKTTTTRMVGHIFKMSGMRVGMTTTDGIYIDGQPYMKGDMTGPWSAGIVLKDPTVEAAVLETARGGILREGLGFDNCDVGCVLNIANDHLGLRGVNTLEEIAWVKSLIIEIVRDGGASVLNADDPLCVEMAKYARGRIVYFSMKGGEQTSDLVRNHVAAGGIAVTLQTGVRGDLIAIYDGDQYIPLLWTHLLPSTLEGKAMHNVANALAATAIAYAHGISVENIKQGLRTFTTSFYQTPGRLNVFDEHPFRVILDYAHNPAAFTVMTDLVQKLRSQHKHVYVITSVPGDRRDIDMLEDGEIVAKMCDTLIIKEDANRRGRKPGEVAALIRQGAKKTGMTDAQIIDVLDETEAIRYAMAAAQTNDLVVVFADNVTAVWKEIVYFGKDKAEQKAE